MGEDHDRRSGTYYIGYKVPHFMVRTEGVFCPVCNGNREERFALFEPGTSTSNKVNSLKDVSPAFYAYMAEWTIALAS